MRKYFKQLTAEDQSEQETAKREEEFQKTEEMSDSDTFAFAFLSDYFKERLRKVKTFQRQQTQALIVQNKSKQTSGQEDEF